MAVRHENLDFPSEGPNRVTRYQLREIGDGRFHGSATVRGRRDPAREVFDPECRL